MVDARKLGYDPFTELSLKVAVLIAGARLFVLAEPHQQCLGSPVGSDVRHPLHGERVGRLILHLTETERTAI
jgi:hypothetical protein